MSKAGLSVLPSKRVRPSHSLLGKRWLHPSLAAAAVLGGVLAPSLSDALSPSPSPRVTRAASPPACGAVLAHAAHAAFPQHLLASPPRRPSAWLSWAQHPGDSRWHLACIGRLRSVLRALSWAPSPKHWSLFGPLSSLGFLLWTQSSFRSSLLQPSVGAPSGLCPQTPMSLPRARHRLGWGRVPSTLTEPSGRAPGPHLLRGGTAPSSLCERLSLTRQPAPPHSAQPPSPSLSILGGFRPAPWEHPGTCQATALVRLVPSCRCFLDEL